MYYCKRFTTDGAKVVQCQRVLLYNYSTEHLSKMRNVEQCHLHQDI